ncbi:MAG: exo-alpha-sialidase [Thermodesulfovibrionales bacterium]|nr:exo-alpha-sialidase [Thermodesulfovibrionales bacterium]
MNSQIALLLLAAVVFLPALFKEKPRWPMPEVRAVLPGTGLPMYRTEFINPSGPFGPGGPDNKVSMSHVASLAPLTLDKDGAMAAAWYSGSREGARDVSIYLSRLDPDSGIWSKPQKVMDRHTASADIGRRVKKIGNALLHTDSGGRLWMFFSTISEGGWSMSTLSYTHSLDGGLTWARSRRMLLSPVMNLTNNVKNKAVALDDGSFLIPAYHELARKFPEAVRFDPATEKYEKRRMGSPFIKTRAIQPALMAGNGGTLSAIFRNMGRNMAKGGNKREKRVAFLSTSHDGGLTWSELSKTDLLNPNSGLDALMLSDGRMLAVANDLPKGRHRLSLLVSEDGGVSWKRIHMVEDSGTPESGDEFSYPFLARDSEGNIHLAYTYKRKRIKHVMFNEAWIKKQAIGNEKRDG